MKNWLKRMCLPLLVVVTGLLLYGDSAALRLTIYNLSAAALVLLLVDLCLDRRQSWGVLPDFHIDDLVSRATSTPIAAALFWLGGVMLVVVLLLLAVPRLSVGAEIPERAKPILPVLSASIDQHWPGAPLRHIPVGQVEQESSWKQTATLKTSRELGRGLVQLTIAYKADGSERFNAYRDAVRYKALADWDWRRDPYSVRHQLTYLVLTDRANFATVRPYMIDGAEAWRAALVCYNAGQGRWLVRRAEARRIRAPTDRWTGGLELAHSSRENVILYGRPLWQAVNEYPRVIFNRAGKYKGVV